MRKIILGLMMLCLMASVANATSFRVASQYLTISKAPINGLVIATSQTVTTDSVYQTGNVGFQSLALMVRGASASVTTTYQLSYDNSTWWTPYVATYGTLSAVGTVSSAQTADRWIVAPAMLAPYIRFNFAQGAGGTATITADTMWQVAD